MLLVHPNGQISHIAPPTHHANPTPSAREINSAWSTLTNALTAKQLAALKPALCTIQRALPATYK